MMQIAPGKFIEKVGNQILQACCFDLILIGANLDSLLDNMA